jgi:hypothetical protein
MSVATSPESPEPKYTSWTITFTQLQWKWGVRFEREHWGMFKLVLSLGAPAIRVTVFGRSIVAGRIPPAPSKTATTHGGFMTVNECRRFEK